MNRFSLGWFLIILAPVFLALSAPYYSGDVKNHLAWAQSLLKLGPFNFYAREFPGYAFPNYPPVMMGLFALSLKVYQLINQASWYLNTHFSLFPSQLIPFIQWENTQIAFLKLPALFAHLLVVYTVDKLFNKRHLSLLLLFNPALLYLTIIWGQVDLLPVALLVLSVYLLQRKNLILSSMVISLSLLTKQTVVIFLPVYMYFFITQSGPKRLAYPLIIFPIIFYLAYLPFHQFDLGWPIFLYRHNFDLVAASVNENALNLWGLIFDFHRVNDGIKFGLLTYQQWGYLMFGLSMVVPIINFLTIEKTVKNLFTFLAIITLGYFLFLTRMHERYLAPAMVYLTILVSFGKKYYLPLIWMSLVYLVNLYHGLFMPYLPFYNFFNNLYFLDGLVAGYLLMFIYLISLSFKND